MELMDVVDHGDKTVGVALREEVYEKNLPHRIVHVLIFNDKGEMALQLRSKDVRFCPHHWSTAVGGHAHSGESYEKAALREFEEELNAKNELELLRKDKYEVEGNPAKWLTTFKTTFNGPFDVNPEEVDKVEFFSLKKIRQMIDEGEKFHPELLFLLNKCFFIVRGAE